jgi:hypothetical protein
MLGLLLVVGLAGPMDGCGPAETQQAPSERSEAIKQTYKERFQKTAPVQKNDARKGSGRRAGP